MPSRLRGLQQKSRLQPPALSSLEHTMIESLNERLDQSGDTCVSLADFGGIGHLAAGIDPYGSPTMAWEKPVREAYDQLVTAQRLVIFGHHVTLPRFFEAEDRLRIAFQRQRGNPHFKGQNPATLLAPYTAELNAGQRQAVRAALVHGQLAITGCAGTGKSRVAAVLARLCQAHGLDVTLAAPTGKAARRLTEVAGHGASTLHGLLEYDGRKFWNQGPLDTDLVLLDEASMVDAALAAALYRAIDRQRTAIVWLGDANQLAPIGAGCPFRDVMGNKLLPTIVLDRVERQTGALCDCCHALLDGVLTPATAGSWYLVDELTDADAQLERVLRAYRFVLDGKSPLRPDEIQVLTPTHLGLLGTRSLNHRLQQQVQALRGVHVPERSTNSPVPFFVGDRVVQDENDYRRDVMNGDVGTVVAVNRYVEVDFGRGPVSYSTSEAATQLDLAYALTVHRSQGSEYPGVILVAPSDCRRLDRNLLYVGASRARKMAMLVGTRATVEAALARETINARKTILGSI